MKKTIYVLSLLTFLAGCKSNDPNPESIIGSWQWKESSSSGFGFYKFGPLPFRTVRFSLTAGGKFTLTENDTLRQFGTYQLFYGKSPQTDKNETQLITKSDSIIFPKDQHPLPYMNFTTWVVSQPSKQEVHLSFSAGEAGAGHRFVRSN